MAFALLFRVSSNSSPAFPVAIVAKSEASRASLLLASPALVSSSLILLPRPCPHELEPLHSLLGDAASTLVLLDGRHPSHIHHVAHLFLVVGAPNSSNSKRLVEVARRAGAKRAELVQRAAEIDWSWLDGIDAPTVGLSAGASAPQIVVDEVIEAFKTRFDTRVELAETVREDEYFPLPRTLRDTELTKADMAFMNG